MDEKKRNIKLIVAYDGMAYHGFQRQANAMTVQQMMEERLVKIFGHEIKLTGAARTDAGVHAYGQTVNFLTTGSIPIESIPAAAKSVLPEDIVVREAQLMPLDFHARFAAKSKIYQYHIYNDKIADPFLRHYVWHIGQQLDVALMQKAVEMIIGEHDFSAFRASGGAPVSPVRIILSASVLREENRITCEFRGTGFLYHMVRNLTGSLVDVGLGKNSPEDFKDILHSRDRNRAGITAPPQGLYLCKVFY